jgi:hypothetical protein
VNDLIGGHVQMFFDLMVVLPQVTTGEVRALGAASAARTSRCPDVPTITEQGVRIDFSYGTVWSRRRDARTGAGEAARGSPRSTPTRSRIASGFSPAPPSAGFRGPGGRNEEMGRGHARVRCEGGLSFNLLCPR